MGFRWKGTDLIDYLPNYLVEQHSTHAEIFTTLPRGGGGQRAPFIIDGICRCPTASSYDQLLKLAAR